MSGRREKQPSRGKADAHADAEPRTTRQMARRAAAGDGARADDDQGRGSPSARDGESFQPAAEDSAMNYDAQVPPRRMSTRSAQARAVAGLGMTTRGRLQIDARAGPERFIGGGEQMSLQAHQLQRRYQSEVTGFPARSDQEWQDVDPESPAFTRALQGNTPRNVEEDKTDTSQDPSTDNGDSSGNNSLEPRQWSEAQQEGNNRPSSAGDLGRENQGDVQCRVSWCEHAGKRYGLCWAHGGVKKCCHRNCPKIALATGEFCSLHEREVSANTF